VIDWGFKSYDSDSSMLRLPAPITQSWI